MDERWFRLSLARLNTDTTEGTIGCLTGWFLSRSLGQDYLVDVIDQEIEKFVCILLHVVVELNLLLPEPSYEFLGCNRAYLLLLCRDSVGRGVVKRWIRVGFPIGH